MGHFEAAQVGGSGVGLRPDPCGRSGAFVLKPENGVNSEQLQNPFYDDVMDRGSERLQTLMRKMRESFVRASIAPCNVAKMVQSTEGGQRWQFLQKQDYGCDVVCQGMSF